MAGSADCAGPAPYRWGDVWPGTVRVRLGYGEDTGGETGDTGRQGPPLVSHSGL